MLTFYSSKRAIIDILIIKEQVVRVFDDDSRYKPFLDLIFAKDYLNDNDLKLPTMKEISGTLNIKYPQLSKLIKELYDKLFDDEELDFVFEFGKVEIIFFVSYFNYYTQIKCKKLAYLPRVGDQIDFSFVQEKVGTGMYYVDRIEHTFEGGTQRIYITLRSGYYNSYLHCRRQKAIEVSENNRKDFHSMSDYELRKELKIGRY
jgi:hypothetical protein